jgi:tripeptide aminopeptidase
MELVQIDSPSRGEIAMAERVRTVLEACGFDIQDDGSGPSCGNVIGRLNPVGDTRDRLLFCAHLDVVEPCRGVRPSLQNGRIVSDGRTVLGADAKAGVAAMLEVAQIIRDLSLEAWAGPLEFLLTWGEEVGHAGAKALGPEALASRYGFVLDALLPTGCIITAAPGYDAFVVRVRGRAAHAGVEPERGISAIAVAAHAIDSLQWGRLDAETTANIGLISGGSVRNAVPEYVELEGEVRSLDPGLLQQRGRAISDAFSRAAATFGAQVDVDLHSVYRGYRLGVDAPSVDIARRAWESIGGTARLEAIGGGSDANELHAAGLECCVLGIGAEACHSVREHIPVDELVRLTEWVLAIIATARASGQAAPLP